MGRIFFGIVLVLISAAVCAFAGEMSEIKLSDGSKVTGEIVSLNAGVYTVKTASMGTIRIDQPKVVSISQKSAVAASAPAAGSTPENSAVSSKMVEGGIDAIKRAMQSNDQVMNSISSLQNDPDFQAVLNDPEVMAAVNTNNIQALSTNPKFLKLLDNDAVQEIGDDLNEK